VDSKTDADALRRAAAVLTQVRSEIAKAGLPASTYRLQLTPSFRFRDAAALVPFLADLGVTHIYLSPILESKPGSEHGYDVVNHGLVREELGGEADLRLLGEAARAKGLGIVVDFVPNHMGIGVENTWWMDVLENGPSSVYAAYFDVAWDPVKAELANKVLLPILGDQYGEVLERGELRLVREGGSFWLTYWEHRFPIAPRQVPRILGLRMAELTAARGADAVELQELQSIMTALEKLAPRHEVDEAKVAERAREKEVAKRRLAVLFENDAALAAFIDENLQLLNGTPGDPRSFDALDQLVDNQAYRLAHWRVAGEEINYRRFFDINSLAAIRMEDPRVFKESHALLFRLIADGVIHGLRIDHPDGLYQPTAYFCQLQEAYLVDRCRALDPQVNPEAVSELVHQAGCERALYVVVEKILEGPERMPSGWAVHGTTGYEFVNWANGVFVDARNEQRFTELHAGFTGEGRPFEELIYEKKRLLMESSMAGEMNMLAHRLNKLSEADRRTRDFTLGELTRAVTEFVACLPIYRTYVEGERPEDVDARDRRYIDGAIARARRRAPIINASLFSFLRDLLLLRHPQHLGEAHRRERVELVRKLQQVTGPVTAKAIEDTAFYVYQRLVSLNEVGGDPGHFGLSVEAFHRLCGERQTTWPGSLNTTSTHDTKRSEDVRARVSVLSEIPDEWIARITKWSTLNAPHRGDEEDRRVPDAGDELLFYQTAVGACPEAAPGSAAWTDFVRRVEAYMIKAVKEAKVHTSWTNPDEAYEEAVRRFAAATLTSRAFLDDFLPFARKVAGAGRLTSLAQVALKLGAPGVTDVYQGCELEDLSLVDPDNRRPVDFARRAKLVGGLGRRLAEGPKARAAVAHEAASQDGMRDGRAKLLLLREGLQLRRAHPALFAEGEYLPIAATGEHAAHVVAFARRHKGTTLLVVVPRLVMQLGPAPRWQGGLLLPEGMPSRFRCVVSGLEIDAGADLGALFRGFPVLLGLAP
jgi:(1->4)-alpha-D-glucan 1-alpha-D-glucosylmutase